MFKMEKLLEELTEILEADEGEITAETLFREHELWDSLAAISLLAVLDDEFNVHISEDDLKTLNSVQDLHDLITSKQ